METTEKSSVQKNTGSRIWRFFGSLKFALFILFSLAVFSIIGTFIQQNQPYQFYMVTYGNRWGALILHLGLDDMYHAWWFSILLVFLVVNIIVCTIDRFPPKWKSVLDNRVEVDRAFIRNLLNNHTIAFNEELVLVKERVLDVLRKKRYKVREANSTDNISIFAWKGTIGRFGSDVTHISLLVILFGAIIGSVFGFRDFIAFYEGEATAVPATNLRVEIDRLWYGIPFPRVERQKEMSGIEVRLDKFWMDYYDTGQIKQYNSILTLTDNGREVIKGRQIWVNEPLHYAGLTFFQSSYGFAYDKVRQAEFLLKDGKTKETIVSPFKADWNMPYDIPGTDYRIRVVGFVSDFAFDPDTKTVFPKSGEHNNPAIQVEIYKSGKMVSRPWLFYNYADLFAQIPDSDYELVFTGYNGIKYSGLSIYKDPGTIIVWIGSALMVIGFFMAFFIFHKRIWVTIVRDNMQTEVYIGGMINKNKFVFERELLQIAESIKPDISGGATR